MKFAAFKKFRTLLGVDIVTQIQAYLYADLARLIDELSVGLSRLTLTENFQGFKVTVTIPTGTESEIRNEFRDGSVPSERIFLRGGAGSQDIVDGDSEWTDHFVYLKNTGASDATVTVLFLR